MSIALGVAAAVLVSAGVILNAFHVVARDDPSLGDLSYRKVIALSPACRWSADAAGRHAETSTTTREDLPMRSTNCGCGTAGCSTD